MSENYVALDNRAYWDARVKFMRDKGPVPEVLWGSKQSQEARFEVVLRVCPPFDSVLDVGCGFGDFYVWLNTRKSAPSRYVGVDMTTEILAEARSRVPSGEFIEGVYPTVAPQGVFDLVFASGIFCRPVDNWEQHVVEACDHMVATARRAVVVNFLSELEPDRPDDGAVRVTPSKVAEMATRITHRFSLHHDYRSNDMTLVLAGRA